MKLKLGFQLDTVLLTAPPVGEQFSLEHEALMSGAMLTVLENPVDVWSPTEPTTVELPFDAWRHLLKQIFHGYKVRSRMDQERSGIVRAPATCEVDGILYSSVRDIPRRPDEPTAVLGAFPLSQPRLLAIDPCYPKISSGVTLHALPGEWVAHSLYRDDLCNGFSTALFAVTHASFDGDPFDVAAYGPEPAGVAGVDGGTCGFFDLAAYPIDKAAHEHQDGSFYEAAVAVAETVADGWEIARKYPGGIVRAMGANSPTFYGDGGYAVLVRRNDVGQVIAACLVFDNISADAG